MIPTKTDFGSKSINSAVDTFIAKHGREPSYEETQILIGLTNLYLMEALTDKMIEAVNILDRIADRDL